MVNWKQNFAVIWLSQFISIMGFNFALPFAPYFIQELGVTDPVRLKMWVAVFAASTPLTLAVFSPIWGMLADRYGRRVMLLRANFAGAIVLALMGTVRSVELLILLRASGLLVTFGTTENFVRHIPEIEDERSPVRAHWADLGPALPILILIVAMAGARQFDQAMLPLLVQDIHGSIQGVSIWTGSLSAFCGIAGLLAAPLLGRLADRVPPPKIGKMSALGAGLLMLPQGLAHSFLLLFGCRFGMVFCAGGLDPVFQIWLSRVTPEHKRGVVFGWAATARSMGWVVAPLVSGVVASALGIRSVFFIGSLLFFGLVPLISVVVKRLARD